MSGHTPEPRDWPHCEHMNDRVCDLCTFPTPDSRLQQEHGEMVAELCRSADTFADIARACRLLGKVLVAEAATIAETSARALLKKIED